MAENNNFSVKIFQFACKIETKIAIWWNKRRWIPDFDNFSNWNLKVVTWPNPKLEKVKPVSTLVFWTIFKCPAHLLNKKYLPKLKTNRWNTLFKSPGSVPIHSKDSRKSSEFNKYFVKFWPDPRCWLDLNLMLTNRSQN